MICDIAYYIQSDYIVTMQHTSLTLTAETLDKAIRYTLDGDWDTFIPAYSEWLNRQYLPPYYVKTSTFVISRKEIITKKGRIGSKVSIFEVPKNEAVDIDSFQDWAADKRILACDL
ncbi:hypothetical protein SAMN02745150_00216 [Brevinema andersonii]|uniref:Uncharacterized protein n=1 Tax=Brevinema andersonii TaxID=34097 RepID=A0A1I1D1M9_BREAD|nr:hypothetical protein SAMN02745150_00216 [Brevinema andersonii]